MTLRAPRAAGSTLIELIVALMLLGLIAALLFSGLRFVGRTAKALEEATRASLDLQLAKRFLMRQIEMAQPLAFSGERDAIHFVAPLPAQLGEGGMYAFSIVALADGEGTKKLVMRHRLYQREPWARFRPGDAIATVLAQPLQDAHFDYLDAAHGGEPAAWVSRWENKDRLPQLVRLNFFAAGRLHHLVVAPKLITSRPPA